MTMMFVKVLLVVTRAMLFMPMVLLAMVLDMIMALRRSLTGWLRGGGGSGGKDALRSGVWGLGRSRLGKEGR